MIAKRLCFCLLSCVVVLVFVSGSSAGWWSGTRASAAVMRLASEPTVQPPAARTQPGQDRSRQASRKAGPSIVWVNQMKPGQSLPPRTQHLTFRSTLVDQDIGYCVYLPPGYEKNTQQRYPVIYNLHGNGGNEFTSLEAIRLLHAGIMEGRWPGMIMVLPNGGHGTFYKDSADGRFPIESIFLQELLPHIDGRYRTIAERQGRCIEGFSMGGRGATRLAVKYPEMFCSLFCQAGNVPHLLETYDETPAELRPGLLLGADRGRWEANDVYALTTANSAKLRKSLRIQIACGTKDGGHIKTIRDWHQHLLAEKIDHTYIELEGLAHRRTEMMQRMESVWFDYHVESLRRAGAELIDPATDK
ncbi:MAG: esterase family protein [Planctomycetaceae bacterium]|nr:esterase family protein [Planctomycetaceae bacterium]